MPRPDFRSQFLNRCIFRLAAVYGWLTGFVTTKVDGGAPQTTRKVDFKLTFRRITLMSRLPPRRTTYSEAAKPSTLTLKPTLVQIFPGVDKPSPEQPRYGKGGQFRVWG
eukprot:CAMPEP_0180308996 /NCGR_PEP_ID=MMETSP0988-20121125/28826_1 /TAXON_ID=697907 /ORGANISM="non described non described, Strain CCMP2293" /LENGTH=108 /DNA_ID=CAMNT_0022292671 /DNA_START=234 /DNA_END=560 /DNA_ORIENTATION=+